MVALLSRYAVASGWAAYTTRRMGRHHLLQLLLAATALAAGVLPAGLIPQAVQVAHADGWWAQTVRPVDLWSGPNASAQSFGELPRGAYVQVVDPQPFPGQARLYVQEATDKAFGYVDAVALAPSGPPPGTGGAVTPPVVAPVAPGGTALFQPFWVANTAPTQLWTTPNADAAAAGDLAQFSRLLVLAPASGTRYYVQDALTERLGYVDAALVGPSGPPDPAEIAAAAAAAAPPVAAPPPAYRPWWVAAHRATDLWSGTEGGVSLGKVARGDQFLVMEPQDGPRLHVLNPKTKNYAYVDAVAVGPADAPKAAAMEVKGWQGTVAGDVVNLRPEPHTFIMPSGQVRYGDRVTVGAWVEGEELDRDNRTWGRIASVQRPAGGDLVDVPLGDAPGDRYIYSGLLLPVALTTPPAPPANTLGNGGARWIDVNLTHQYVTAYEGSKAVYSAATTSGRPGWETPTGIFRIQRRVENETMVGSTLLRLDTFEIPDYRLENVKWTQYFTSGGAAIHTNYWRPAQLFGLPSSHGCLGMLEQHARWFWGWATVGTPLLVHF